MLKPEREALRARPQGDLLEAREGREVEEDAVRRLKNAGAWESLAQAALWQFPAADGTPVHDASGALAQILDHAGTSAPGAAESAEILIGVLGRERTANLLLRAGRNNLSREAWLHWKRTLGLPLEPEDDDGGAYADGWVERLSRASRQASSRTEAGIPDAEPGENIGWGAYPDSGKPYPFLI